MNKNLLKILALSAIASVSLSGCFGPSGSKSSSEQQESSGPESSESIPDIPVAEVISLSEAFEYDTVEKEFVKAGQLVKLQQLCVYARWGHTIIVGVPYAEGGSILSLQGIEVEMDAQPDWKGVTNGRYANVDVEGTLANVNGRPVLQGATVTINAEAKYDDDGNRDDNDGAFSAAYWSTSVTIRDYWDQYLGRSLSGILMEGIFQFASAPAAITADTETDFKIVFPGENTNGEDPDNEYLINVHVPKGLNEASVAFYNDFFVGKQAGDFVDMMGMTRFDMSKKGMGYVLDDFWIRYADDVADEDKPTILTSWADVDAAVSPKFKTALPNLADCESQGVFSYTLTSHFSSSIKDAEIFDEDTLEGLQIDVDEAAAYAINLNCGGAKAQTVLASARELLVAAGYALDEELSNDKNKDYYYVLKDASEKVVSEINIWAASGAKSVSMIFMAYRATDEEAATLDAALDIVRGRAAAAVEGFASALPADLPADAETGILSVVADWRNEDYVDGALIYSLEPELNPEVFASNTVFETYADGFEALLEASGFKAGFAVPAIGELDGYYNATSHEFVSIYLEDDGAEEPSYVGIEFTYVVVTGENVCFDLAPEATWTVDGAVAYVSALIPLIFGRAPTLYPNADTGMVDVFIGGLAQASALAYAQQYVPQAIPSSATYLGAAQEPVEEGSELNKTYFCFSLPSANEGMIIELDIYVEWYNATNAYLGVYIFETTAE